MEVLAKADLPRITVITPNYNYGEFLERTIDSVLSQGYPNLNYIVIDGGSTDQSKSIIEKYQQHLSYWHSQQDNGQADAINIGLRHADGKVFNWINSDDILTTGSLFTIAENYLKSPNSLIAGHVLNVPISAQESSDLVTQSGLELVSLLSGRSTFHQPGLWWNLERINSLGPLDTNLDYCFDYLLLLRYIGRWPLVTYTDATLAHFTLHSSSKTTTSQQAFDQERVSILRLLLDDDALAAHTPLIRDKIQIYDWYDTVDKIRHRDSSPKLFRIAQIISLAIRSPSHRLSRFTAGAIKRLLAA
jgi:glycosyltransferase involved in cell wall biosynthesis